VPPMPSSGMASPLRTARSPRVFQSECRWEWRSLRHLRHFRSLSRRMLRPRPRHYGIIAFPRSVPGNNPHPRPSAERRGDATYLYPPGMKAKDAPANQERERTEQPERPRNDRFPPGMGRREPHEKQAEPKRDVKPTPLPEKSSPACSPSDGRRPAPSGRCCTRSAPQSIRCCLRNRPLPR